MSKERDPLEYIKVGASVARAQAQLGIRDAMKERNEIARAREQLEREKWEAKLEAEHQAWLDSHLTRGQQAELERMCYEQLPEVFAMDEARDFHVRQEYLDSLKSSTQKGLERHGLAGLWGTSLFFLFGASIGFLVTIFAKVI